MNLNKIFLYMAVILFAANVNAATVWKIIPNESEISFTATQNNAPLTGKFTVFHGDIEGDKDKLNESRVKIVVDMRSVQLPFEELITVLKTSDWLYIDKYPQATFEAHNFLKLTDHTYQAKGTLTIRDKTQPVTLRLLEETYAGNKAKISGNVLIRRNAFGVGGGAWTKTDELKDEVVINFKFGLIKQPS